MGKNNITGQCIKKILLGSVISTSLFGGAVFAGMNTPMQSIFGEMTTSTNPGEYESSLGTTFYLGSMKTRTPIVNLAPLMTIQPPNIRGGCGGFDMTAGSVGFISGEDLASFLKGISSNAQNLLVYGLMMTIKSQCQACSDMMTWLHDVSQYVNQQNLNSCEAAKRILTGEVADDWNRFSDNLKDVLKERQFFGGGSDEKKEIQKRGLTGYLGGVLGVNVNKNLGGNIVFSELRRQSVASWFGMLEGTDDSLEFYESILSLTGGIYVGYTKTNPTTGKTEGCTPSQSDNDTQTCKMNVRHIGNTLNLQDIFEGAKSKKVIRCDTPLNLNDPCDKWGIGDAEIKSFRTLFDEIFTEEGGLLEKISTENVQLTQEQISIIGTLSQYTPSMQLLRTLSTNPSTMRAFYYRASGIISLEMTYGFVTAILDATISSLQASDKVANKETLEKLYIRKVELAEEYSRLMEEQQVKSGDITLHQLYMQMNKNGG